MIARIQQAIELANQGRIAEALAILRDVLRQDPNQPSAWKWLAHLSPDPQEALTAAWRAMQLEPGDPWVQAALPVLQERARQVGRAPHAEPEKARPRRRSGIAWALAATIICISVALAGRAALNWLGSQGRLGVFAAGIPDRSATLSAAPPQQEAPPPMIDEAAASTPAAVEQAPLSPSITLETHTETTTYSFTAGTVNEVQRALYALGPALDETGEHAIAATTYQLWVVWQAAQAAGTCRLASATVNVDLLFTYPEWEPAAFTDTSLFDEWDRFMAHVVDHEEQHAAVVNECALELMDQLAALPPTAHCYDLDATINQMVDALYQTCEARQAAFDEVEGWTSFPLP
jgi:predicted secreted Zn-dependent protease